MENTQRPRGDTSLAVRRMMHPKSIAVIGASARPGSAGYNALTNIIASGYPAKLYPVGRSGGSIAGLDCLTSIDELPEGVDLAIFTLPSQAVRAAVDACVARKVASAVIFAAGFSEVGGAGDGEQQAIAKAAAAGGLALLGPNCLGFSNLVEGLGVGFFPTGGAKPKKFEGCDGIAVLGQSGLLAAVIRGSLEARGLATSYFVTTGNEAGLGLAEFLDDLATDGATRTIVVFAEQVRRPGAFLAATAKARAAGKSIVMLHTGKSERAKATARSHTGALAGDYATMRMRLEQAGIAFVDTLEEIVDVADLLARFPEPPTKGVGIVSFSGAFCGQSHDYCEALGLDIPPLSPEIAEALRPQVPEFAPPANPLDLTTQPAWQPELLGIGTKALLDDPAIGSVVIAIPMGAGPQGEQYLGGLLPRLEGNKKPIVFGAMSDGQALSAETARRLSSANLSYIPSPERALRAIARLTAYGRRIAKLGPPPTIAPYTDLPALGKGAQPEWLGKKLLAAIGIKIPDGALARSLEEATATAARIGYPVALKAQAAALLHKTEAGGVILGIADPGELARAWDRLHRNIKDALPDLALEGVLVETLAPKGLELMIGARRDPDWGPVLMAGLGGIWVEALADIRLFPADLSPERIAEELCLLRCVKLLRGFRGQPPLDIAAVADAAARIGRLILTRSDIHEIDVNPLVVYPRGHGALALDALVVTAG